MDRDLDQNYLEQKLL